MHYHGPNTITEKSYGSVRYVARPAIDLLDLWQCLMRHHGSKIVTGLHRPVRSIMKPHGPAKYVAISEAPPKSRRLDSTFDTAPPWTCKIRGAWECQFKQPSWF
ncbi:hypothetical protein AMTRI_Chr13g88780 [Amborella trichopoda]